MFWGRSNYRFFQRFLTWKYRDIWQQATSFIKDSTIWERLCIPWNALHISIQKRQLQISLVTYSNYKWQSLNYFGRLKNVSLFNSHWPRHRRHASPMFRPPQSLITSRWDTGAGVLIYTYMMFVPFFVTPTCCMFWVSQQPMWGVQPSAAPSPMGIGQKPCDGACELEARGE